MLCRQWTGVTVMYCLVNIPEYILREEYIKNRPAKHMGYNTGNCLFWESTKNLLRQQNLNLLSLDEFRKNTVFYQDKVSSVVFTLANLLGNYDPQHSSPDWTSRLQAWISELLSVLDGLNCKKYLISIGSQAHNLAFFKFTDSQKKQLQDFFLHFEIIYLRGQSLMSY